MNKTSDNEEACDVDVDDLGNSMFETKFHVPRTRKRIQAKWGIKMTLPDHRASKESMVSIKGKSRNNVCDAKRELAELVAFFRGKLRPTHFTCVPTCTDDFMKAFNQIKDEILSNGFPGIDESLFIDAKKIHITCAICTLLDAKDESRAVDIFETCCKDFKEKMSSKEVTIRGLAKFDREPTISVRVIYAKVDSPSLQEFADGVIKKFKEAGLSSVNQEDSATLHMTVMNVKYRLGVNKKAPKKFDATEILNKYAEYNFGTLLIDEIHLSQMGKPDKKGFYNALHISSLKEK